MNQLEPTTALDVTTQSQIIDLLIKLCKKMNMAMIFISHNLLLIEKIADKICIMQHGKIVEQGAIKDIFTNPQHEYTKELLDKKEPIVNEQGVCPYCGSENVSYGGFEIEGEECYYELTCDDCDENSYEWYSLKHIETRGTR